MRQLILALSLVIAAAATTGCITQTVLVVVTATPPPPTPLPETATVTATTPAPPPATPTPTSTPRSTIGPTPLPEGFPTPVSARIMVAEQVFERGRMFWLAPVQEIWVVVEGGDWARYEDTFEEGEAEYDPALTPPAGLQQPIRGFGKVWRENESVRAALGWARDVEYGYTTDYRYDHGGTIDPDGNYESGPGVHTLVTLGNETVHFYEADDTWALEATR
jgi:hypothetical protein